MYQDEIRDMQIRARRIESDVAKGKKPSDEDCNNVSMSYRNVVDGLKISYPERSFKREIDSRCYTLSPHLLPFYIKEIVVDILDLAGMAFSLMLENMRTPKKPKAPPAKQVVQHSNDKNNDMSKHRGKHKEKDTNDYGYEGSEQDKRSIQQINNQKITGKYSGSLDNVVTAQSREQKEAVQRQQQVQTQANTAAHEQTTSQAEQSMSMSNN